MLRRGIPVGAGEIIDALANRRVPVLGFLKRLKIFQADRLDFHHAFPFILATIFQSLNLSDIKRA
jgi:hypothetical protein